MDNVTHSLVGAALAEVALPADASPARRRVFFVLGVVAANLPDADLVYTRITVAPLGYLLHHRGHTHTVVGLLAQGAAVAALCALPAIRRAVGAANGRLLVLLAACLASHLVLDSWNSYGVHPFWPLDARWFYGDAIYILEPWIWLPLGAAAALNTRHRRWSMTLGVVLALLPVVLAVMGMIPVVALLALAAARALTVVGIRRFTPRRRSTVALATVALFVTGMLALRQQVRADVRRATPPSDAREVDLVLTSRPANPLCWNALSIRTRAAADELVLAPAQVALLGGSCGEPGPAVAWQGEVRQSLSGLRALADRDCTVRAWLQFARAPRVAGGVITDARFGGAERGNFSTMLIGGECPTHVPGWVPPRDDVLRAGGA